MPPKTNGGFDYPPTPVSISTAFESPEWVPSPTTTHHANDVAIVGMSCRTAGGNDTPDKLWKFLMNKKHASGEVPRKRWEPWIRRDTRNAQIIANTTSKGYFIENLENFDAAFFGISPKEAELMDPHQRLALELSWEALENAGIEPKRLAGSDTAVFMGVDSDDYSRLIMEDLPNVEAWSGIGTAYHGIPNRISYHLDLMGPSTAVDAACASSLIAIHLGRQAILSGESTVALCGGVNVLCAPGLTHMLDKAGALASDGLCISFDDGAHGYARGEGGAIVVLKKLSSAMADNDNILAVLKGTATAQDGKTNGIMAPNAKAQEMVARQALLRAGGLDPSTINYVEAHATSTSLGDPTEVDAISRVYGIGRGMERPCAIGSIKPNVGHLEAAAGAIGFVKTVMAVNKGELAPQTLLKKLNTRVDWDSSGLSVVQDASKWPESLTPRRAAVCSYGYGGSVAHAIIEQSPASYQYAQENARKIQRDGSTHPVTLILSAFQEKRLAGQASQLADWLMGDGREVDLKSVAITLSQRRAAQDYRVSFVVENRLDAIEALKKFAAGVSGPWVTSSRVLASHIKRGVVWVFSGHGAQWINMARDLLHDTAFHQRVAALEELVEKEAGFSPLSALESGTIGSASMVQVLTYLMQVGLAEVLRTKGVEPQAIIGHSVGEIAASVVAGCLSHEEGALLVSRRARLYEQFEDRGGMALVHLPFAQVHAELGERTHGIVAAIDSSPSSCVVSGEIPLLEEYIIELAKRDVKTFRVKSNIAFHSPMLRDLISPLRNSMAGAIVPRTANVPIYSTSHTDPRTGAERDVEYWVNNMIEPVYLTKAVNAAVDDGFQIFLEVSSHPIVTHSISEILAARGIEDLATFGVMKRETPSDKTVLQAVAQLHNIGAAVDFETQLGTLSWATSVPGTPWVQKPYWKEVETGSASSFQQHDVSKHTLLGHVTDVAGSDMRIFTTSLDEKTKPYPLTHPLDNTEIIPAAVYCNTFRQATDATVLKDVQLRIPTPITSDQRQVQVVAQGDMLQLSSRLDSTKGHGDDLQYPWTIHSSCKWSNEETSIYNHLLDIADIQKRIATVLPNDFAWKFLQKIGVSGIAYPWAVLQHYGNDTEMLVKMDMDPSNDMMIWDATSWAPFLDAATSVGSSIFFNSPKMRIVSGIDQVLFVSRDPPPKIGYLYIEEATDSKSLAADISVLSAAGELLAKLKSMRFSDMETSVDRNTGVDALVHRLAWVPPAFAESPLALDSVLLVCSDEELAHSYLDGMQAFVKRSPKIASADELDDPKVLEFLSQNGVVVLYVPGRVCSLDEVPEQSREFTWEATRLLQFVSSLSPTPKLFIITDSIYKAASPTTLAQGPLYGFARIAAQEHPEIWGGLIDNEGSSFPVLALKYVQEQDVMRMEDGLPRVARMRPFSKHNRKEKSSAATLQPKSRGTYVVTGGFGDIGLEILDYLVEKGARRIVVISRSSLPPRRQWATTEGRMGTVVDKIKLLETKGASIYGISLDISTSDAKARILTALDQLNLPPVLGVVHAAGINEDGLIKDITSSSLSRVFAPKVTGALTLHNLFPPTTLDFFILFSSIGQLVGTAGQAPYGAANAFLDTLATHRRHQGDNSIAIQWTAWRGMGLAADSEFLTAELNSKGITDITRDEGFQAWEYLENFDTDHAVVTRARILDADEPVPFPLVAEVVQRRARVVIPAGVTGAENKAVRPTSGPELRVWLSTKIRECIGAVLHMDVEDIDVRAAVTDLGVDSVMTVALRQKLQSMLGVKVPPTLIWKEPTVGHLVEWFKGKMDEA